MADIESPDPIGDPICIKVLASQLGQRRSAIDDAAEDRRQIAHLGMRIVELRRRRDADRVARNVVVDIVELAFFERPLIVAALDDQVNLFAEEVADVAHPQLAGLAIEGEAERIAEAECVELLEPVWYRVYEGIVVWNEIALT